MVVADRSRGRLDFPAYGMTPMGVLREIEPVQILPVACEALAGALEQGFATPRPMECAAIVNLALLRDLAPYTDCRRARSLLVRLVQMLTKLQLTMRGRL